MSNKGEFITEIGTKTQMIPNQRGIAKVTAEGTNWTSAPRLSHLNGGKWKIEGKVNTIKETVEMRGNFEVSICQSEITKFVLTASPTANIMDKFKAEENLY